MNKSDKLQIAQIVKDIWYLEESNDWNYYSTFEDNIDKCYDLLKSEYEATNNESALKTLETMFTGDPDYPAFKRDVESLLKPINSFAEGGEIPNEIDDIAIVKINNKFYRLFIAKTPEEKEKGLMGVEEMDEDEGMLFDYRDDIQKECSFWMKDTYIPLDIIFVNKDNEVISVHTRKPETLEGSVEKNVAYVIEVNANSDIKKGDKVEFKSILIDELEEDKLYVLGADGKPQAELQGGERIFSIKNSKTLISMAIRANESKSDTDYKALGRKVFEYMKIQDNREPEYVKE